MRTRKKRLEDYGIGRERARELLVLARQEHNRDLLCRAVESSCPWLSEYLVRSLTGGGGYDKIYKRVYIPATKADFYGYRRKALAAFDDLLKRKGDRHGCQTYRQAEKENHS